MPAPFTPLDMLLWSVQRTILFVAGAMLFLLVSFLSIDSLLRDQGAVVRRSVMRGSNFAAAFRLTEAQWQSVATGSVESRAFDASLVAEGVLTINDGANIPVYSPYAGRVVSIEAQVGQAVRKGSVLAFVSVAEVANFDGDPSAITAPFDGVVVRRQLGIGEFVDNAPGGGSGPLFVISDLRTLSIQTSVAESDAPRVALGEPIEVSIPAFPSRRIRTRVTWMASTINPVTHRVAIRAVLPNGDLQLKPRMSATVRFLEGGLPRVAAVPGSAVIPDGAASVCYVVVADRTLAVRRIRTGRTEDGLVEVTAGLRAGDRVVIDAASLIAHVSTETVAIRATDP